MHVRLKYYQGIGKDTVKRNHQCKNKKKKKRGGGGCGQNYQVATFTGKNLKFRCSTYTRGKPKPAEGYKHTQAKKWHRGNCLIFVWDILSLKYQDSKKADQIYGII